MHERFGQTLSSWGTRRQTTKEEGSKEEDRQEGASLQKLSTSGARRQTTTEEGSKEEDRQGASLHFTSAPSCLSSSLLPYFVVCLHAPEEDSFVKSACALLFPCISSHW